jgi:hypothetical protein
MARWIPAFLVTLVVAPAVFGQAGLAKAPPTLKLVVPAPKVEIAAREDYATKSGTSYVIYRLSVTNLAAYPSAFFRRTADLPPNPCRSTEAVRLLWSVRSEEGKQLSCGEVPKREEFRATVRKLTGPDEPSVRLVLIDAKTGNEYPSDLLPLTN